MAKATLFIDGQVFQSVAWDRGMGKYSLALLKSILNDPKYNYGQTCIIFTKHMSLSREANQAIQQIAPAAEHIFSDLKVPVDPSLANITDLQKQNQHVLDKTIEERTDSSNFTFFILALFIDQVCSVFPRQGNKALLFYDLIPLQFSERYSLLRSYQNYLARYKTIFEADLILTISQTVADDLALNLGISQAKVCNINGAPIEHLAKSAKKPNINLPSRYILMPSGDELRKNNVNAVQGFEAFRRESNEDDIALVLTSHFTEATQNTLKSYSKNIIFTGNVPEEELRWLYENAQALLFAPEYEGLGLPILEAAGFGLPIACSNLNVFNEISPSAFYYSDPSEPISIATALKSALDRAEFKQKSSEYPEILARYTWANTAELTLKALSQLNNEKGLTKKMKLAVLAPTPGGYSAIGKLIMQLHPSMEEYFDVDYYLEEGKSQQGFSRPNYLPYISKVLPSSEFGRKAYKKYDAVLYHLGNSEFHMDTIRSALYMPGFAVFHDTHMADVFEGVLPTYGYLGEGRLKAEQLLDEKIHNPKAQYVTSLVNNQQALIFHSDYTGEALKSAKLGGKAPALRLNLPTAVPKQLVPKETGSQIIIGLAGIIHPAKGLDVVERLAQSQDFYDCKIHIFGLSLVSDDIISRLRAYPNVQVDTSVTDFQFQNMLSRLDVLVNFRTKYKGETSLATIEAMRFGVVPIVKKIGWYEELPDKAVLKVPNEDALVGELKRLIGDTERLNGIKKVAREYVASNHTYQAYAQGLYEFISRHPGTGQADKVAQAIKVGASLGALKRLISEGQ